MNLEKRKIIRVSEVMKTDVDIVSGRMTVAEALKSLKYPDTRTMIVDKRHEDDEYGVVMLRDIALMVMAPDKSPSRVNIYEIMSKPVMSVNSNMDIRYCAKLLDRFGLSRAPVIDNGKIVGLVSYSDIVLKGMKV
jgi:predicted transcriptional regulator